MIVTYSGRHILFFMQCAAVRTYLWFIIEPAHPNSGPITKKGLTKTSDELLYECIVTNVCHKTAKPSKGIRKLLFCRHLQFCRRC